LGPVDVLFVDVVVAVAVKVNDHVNVNEDLTKAWAST
jgi:hypothetical protein